MEKYEELESKGNGRVRTTQTDTGEEGWSLRKLVAVNCITSCLLLLT